jgi:hypothetical protein
VPSLISTALRDQDTCKTHTRIADNRFMSARYIADIFMCVVDVLVLLSEASHFVLMSGSRPCCVTYVLKCGYEDDVQSG